MPKDIRKLLENYPEESASLSEKHALNFESKLMKELHQEKPKRRNIYWLSIAASLALLVTVGIQFIDSGKTVEPPVITEGSAPTENVEPKIQLGNISPELNAIETYYTNSIKLELSQLDMTDENKELVDTYLKKVKELTNEYKTLTLELTSKGVNDQTVDALIRNLQLRLQLLQRLKKQLNDLKDLKDTKNENNIV